MKLIKHILFLALFLSCLSFYSGCNKGDSKEKDEAKKKETSVPVEVAEVKEGEIAAYFTSTATLEAEEETEVVAKVGGVVKKIFVEEGTYVRAGQVLAKLDDERLLVLQEQANSNLLKLESTYKRSQELMQKKLISTEEFQRTKFEYEHQKAAYELTRLDVAYTKIQAPISGVISARNIKIGNMILPNQATFKITGLNPLIAELHIPERQLHKLKVGHPAQLMIDALDSQEFNGHVERICPVVDPTSGTVKVTVAVRDKSRSLKPGMFSRIKIIYDVRNATLLVPKDAIMAEDKISSVFVVRDSLAFRQTIETGYINTTHIEVLAGLECGDTVVTTGKSSLKDSSRVDFVNKKPTQLSLK